MSVVLTERTEADMSPTTNKHPVEKKAPESAPARRRSSSRGRRWLAIAAIAVILATGGGWWLVAADKSDVAAETSGDKPVQQAGKATLGFLSGQGGANSAKNSLTSSMATVPVEVVQQSDVLRLTGSLVADENSSVASNVSGIAAEVLDHVCQARTDLVVRILLEQLEGGLTSGLNHLLSKDFSTEQLLQKTDQLLATWAWGKRLTTPATIAVIGPTNAGKSSLANLLSGQSGSIVTSQPGTTRDWVTHHVSLDGLPIVLIDTAGHRESADALEAEAIARAVQQSRHADVQLVVIDGASSQVRLPVLAKQTPTVLAVNKADLDTWSLDAVPPDLANDTCIIKTAAVTGQGQAELTSALLKALGCENLSETSPVVFTERQRSCLQQAADILADINRPEQDRLDIAKASLSECLHGGGI